MRSDHPIFKVGQIRLMHPYEHVKWNPDKRIWEDSLTGEEWIHPEDRKENENSNN